MIPSISEVLKPLRDLVSTWQATNRELKKLVTAQQQTQKTLVEIGRILQEKNVTINTVNVHNPTEEEEQPDDGNGSTT